MIIRIGRDSATSTLRITQDGKSILDDKIDVPSSVGNNHCQIEYGNNTMTLRNLDINNYTYVNGQAIEVKAISKTDTIELGVDHFSLNWNMLESLLPSVADIRPLREIWDNYEKLCISLQIDERRFNTLRSVTGLITMIAIALTFATGGKSSWHMLLYGIAIIASLGFFIKAYRDASIIPNKRQELNRQFQQTYICPHCGRFLGNQSYDILSQNACCPYCKAKFIH